WSDPIWLDRGEHGGFDPSLLFADGEVYYLRDGKGPTQDHPRVFEARIDPTTGALREPMRVIWEGTGGIWPEGAHVYKMKGHYYLFAAEGGTEYGHAEMGGRSASPYGPFEPCAVGAVRAVAAHPGADPWRSPRASDPGDRTRGSGRARRRDDLGGVPRHPAAGRRVSSSRARDVPRARAFFRRRVADDRRRR